MRGFFASVDAAQRQGVAARAAAIRRGEVGVAHG